MRKKGQGFSQKKNQRTLLQRKPEQRVQVRTGGVTSYDVLKKRRGGKKGHIVCVYGDTTSVKSPRGGILTKHFAGGAKETALAKKIGSKRKTTFAMRGKSARSVFQRGQKAMQSPHISSEPEGTGACCEQKKKSNSRERLSRNGEKDHPLHRPAPSGCKEGGEGVAFQNKRRNIPAEGGGVITRSGEQSYFLNTHQKGLYSERGRVQVGFDGKEKTKTGY